MTGILLSLAIFILSVISYLNYKKELKAKDKKIAELESKLSDQFKLIEQRISLSDKYAKMLADVASKTFEAVIITDKEGVVEWVNEGFTKITGYSLEEVKGKKPGKLLQGPETDPFTIDRIREKIKQKVIFKEEILNYHKTGRKYWLSMSITPVFDFKGELEKFIAIETDITEQKQIISDLETKIKQLNKS